MKTSYFDPFYIEFDIPFDQFELESGETVLCPLSGLNAIPWLLTGKNINVHIYESFKPFQDITQGLINLSYKPFAPIPYKFLYDRSFEEKIATMIKRKSGLTMFTPIEWQYIDSCLQQINDPMDRILLFDTLRRKRRNNTEWPPSVQFTDHDGDLYPFKPDIEMEESYHQIKKRLELYNIDVSLVTLHTEPYLDTKPKANVYDGIFFPIPCTYPPNAHYDQIKPEINILYGIGDHNIKKYTYHIPHPENLPNPKFIHIQSKLARLWLFEQSQKQIISNQDYEKYICYLSKLNKFFKYISINLKKYHNLVIQIPIDDQSRNMMLDRLCKDMLGRCGLKLINSQSNKVCQIHTYKKMCHPFEWHIIANKDE